MIDRDPQDPAWQPVEEAGGGESEGFEQAERDLVEHSEHGDPAPDPGDTAFTAEEEADLQTGEPGEADQVEPADGPDAA
jgi:hypothetical protein